MSDIHQIDNTNLGILWQRIRTFVMALLTCKADRSTTLSGYGITDAYTKSDVDDLVEQIELTPGPQGEQGEKGDKGDKGDTGAAGRNGTNGIGIGLAGEIDVDFVIKQAEGTNVNYVHEISHLDDVTKTGLYVLHSEHHADSILSVEQLNDSIILQYVIVGGFIGINTQKFISRTCTEGHWGEWTKYDICADKQKALYSGDNFTITIGEVLLQMNADKLFKLKQLLEG